MANFNKVILLGNLTRDPQLRYTPSQVAVCEFGLAVNRRWNSKDGQQREETAFVDCTAWGRQAETIQKYMSKGQPMLVEGRLTWHQWDGPDGKRRSKLSVTVERFQFLGGEQHGGDDAMVEEPAAKAKDDKPFDPGSPNDEDVDDDTVPF